MPTNLPNFNFLARLVLEIWRVSQNKKWSADFPRRRLSNKLLHGAILPYTTCKCLPAYNIPTFNFRDKEGVPKFNVGDTSPLPYPVRWNFYVCSKYWQDQTTCQISASYLYASCSYANVYFSQAFHYMSKNVFGGFWEGRCENTVFWPPKGTTLCENASVCWCIACQNRFNGLSSRSVERFCVHRNNKKLNGNFGYMGKSNPWGDLDQM